MTGHLTATLEPANAEKPTDELVLTLRVANDSDKPIELLNPDLGRPSPAMNWPGSIELYRASLLMSYGYLAIAVSGDDGKPVAPEAIQTWATPVLGPPVVVAPGDALDVPIPIGRLFSLEPGCRYRVAVDYGDATLKVRAESEIEVPGEDDGPADDGPADGA